MVEALREIGREDGLVGCNDGRVYQAPPLVVTKPQRSYKEALQQPNVVAPR